MRTKLIRHTKVTDELGNTIEMKIWKLPEPTGDKPHGYKYSLAYIVNDKRIIGYDNAEGKGDHRHIRNAKMPYRFTSLIRLSQDFYRDIEKYNGGEL